MAKEKSKGESWLEGLAALMGCAIYGVPMLLVGGVIFIFALIMFWEFIKAMFSAIFG